MKRFIRNIVVFVGILVVCDILCGFGLKYLVEHAKGGDTALNNSINNDITDPIIIFGSSRAMHHYDPLLLEDTLGRSCYNCALDGNGIILMYGRYKMISERYNPELIMYDVIPSFDLLETDNHRYLPNLRYYYDRPSIDSILWSVDATERYKMLSKCYQYNMGILQLVMDNIHPMQQNLKGYKPMDRVMKYEPVKKSAQDEVEYKYDKLKLYYWEKLFQDAKGKSQIVLFASPLYKNTDDKVYAPIIELANKYDIPFLNYYCDSSFNFRKDYFYDSGHMNRTGATAYTKEVASRLKALINK